MTAEVIPLDRYEYGECHCGSTQYHLLLDPDKSEKMTVIGLQCAECEEIARFDEDDIIEFEADLS